MENQKQKIVSVRYAGLVELEDNVNKEVRLQNKEGYTLQNIYFSGPTFVVLLFSR